MLTHSLQLAEMELAELRRTSARERMIREAREERKRQRQQAPRAPWLARLLAAIRVDLRVAGRPDPA